MRAKVKNFIQQETVLVIAALAAAVSACIIKPDRSYMGYIDYRVLALLFCLMLIVAGFMKSNLFEVISYRLLQTAGDSKKLTIALVNITFFSAMLVTNDVALLTFVPLTIGVFGKRDNKQLIFAIVMETIAANLGSLMTPVGNPQNLYLYSLYKMHMWQFLRNVLPIGILSFLLLNGITWMQKSIPIDAGAESTNAVLKRGACIRYAVLFVIALCAVLRVVDYRICLVITALVILICDRELFQKVDYSLLLTFVAFFIFVGNMGNITAIRNILTMTIKGKEFLFGVLLSQIISNVPAAVMLSGFTQNAKSILIGTNVGGLGTLVASLASLISYKLYAKSQKADKKQYMLVFTGWNILFLVILLFFAQVCMNA